MIEEKIQSEVEVAVQSVYPTSKFLMKDIEVTRSLGKGHGDFSTNIAFKLAGELKKSPKEIACSLVGAFSDNVFEKVEAVNGFINFYLKKEHYFQVLEQILSKSEHYADLDIFKGKKIQVEFISANPTGPLTLANGRGGYGGDVLANVFSKVGAMVEREYYINDGGNQVRILGDSMLIAAGLLKKEDDYYRGPYIDEWVSANPELIQKYKNDNFALGSYAANDVLNNLIKPSVKKMGITYDNWFSEKELISRGEVDEALGKFKEQGITKTQDGALWFMTTKFGDDKDRVIVKADGEKTYFANDAAYHWDKFYKRKFDKVINLWGADHHGYIGRMQAAVTAMGFPGQLTVLIMQIVRLVKDGQEFKMSKRKGTFVTMDDLHELIGSTDASDVTRFFFLSRAFSTQMDFDLDMAKERSDKNPVFYVKYAYARLSSILRKSTEINTPKANIELLVEPEEIELIDQMSQLPQVLASIVMFDEYPVHYLTFYAIDLAKKFHSFYDKCKVIDEENLEMTAARLELVKATKIVLGIVMRDLIGIDTPEKM
ncbi:MAG: arginine--tRNA ligase [bacterium]